MKVKGIPNKVTMHSSSKTIYVPVFLLMSLLSRGHCECVFKGVGTTFAVCTDAFPEVSSISSSELRHLDIHHAVTLPVFRLTSSYFAGIDNCKFLESIRIHNTSLSSIDKNTFSGLKYLQYLDISDNSLLKSFHEESVSDVTSLKILLLNGNVRLFNQISGPILISDSLEELDLSRCEIEYLHNDAFNQLKRLTYLNIAFNKIRKIPAATFGGLHHLTELDLSHNLIDNLPDYMLQNSSSVDVLKLRGNPISEIPKDIFFDSGNVISQLDLSETELVTLNIPPLEMLITLNLGGSHVSSLKDIDEFPVLENLNLSYTKITEIDSYTFENNSHLETIRLSGNPNLSLPHQFKGHFSFVALLDISNCNLAYLMPNLFKEMKSIVHLNLSNNAFNDSESLGKALSPLRILEVLDLTHNKLRAIEEDDFSGNNGLKTLLLSGNPLVSAPSLVSTPYLNHLDLSQCTLTRLHLPAIFREALYLSYLFLSHNNLSSLNDEAYLNPSEDEDSPWDLPEPLLILDLRDNPWSCDPSFVSLIHEVKERGVAISNEPPQRSSPSDGEPAWNLDQEWEELVNQACEQDHYDVSMTLKPLNFPPTLEGTVTAKFPIWLTVGIVIAIVLASAILLCKLFQRHMEQLQQTKTLIPTTKSEIGKINVSLVGSAGGIKMAGRAKDYQRLKEDRSPSSPETPRIYRPPVKGGHFTFPDIPDGKDPESCD